MKSDLEQDEQGLPLTADERLEGILDNIGVREGTECRVYKLGESKKPAFCCTYANITPDNPPPIEDIGTRFGAGKYRLVLKYEDSNVKTGKNMREVFIELDSSWDKVKAKAEREEQLLAGNGGMNLPAIVSAIKDAVQPGDSSGMMQVMMQGQQQAAQMQMQMMMQFAQMQAQMMGQIITAISGKPTNGNDKLVEILLAKTLNHGEDTGAKMLEMMERGIAAGKASVSGAEAEEGWKAIVGRLVDQAGMVLNNVIVAKIAKNEINNPTYQALLQDPEKRAYIENELESKHGAEKAAQIKQTLGIVSRPIVDEPLTAHQMVV